jgi:hypothetical protein
LFDSGALVGADYSLHPLVLGDGFEHEDVKVEAVNVTTKRMSGINNKLHKKLFTNISRTYSDY